MKGQKTEICSVVFRVVNRDIARTKIDRNLAVSGLWTKMAVYFLL